MPHLTLLQFEIAPAIAASLVLIAAVVVFFADEVGRWELGQQTSFRRATREARGKNARKE